MNLARIFRSFLPALRRMAYLVTLAVLLAVLALGAAPVRPVQAAVITVSTTSDELDAGTCATILPAALPGADGKISLREAICAANNAGGASTITLPAPGTYGLSLGELPVGTQNGTSITLSGSGTAAQGIITRSSGTFRLFNVDPNQVGGIAFSIAHLSLQNGVAGSLGGGAILAGGPAASGESLAINDCILSGNATTGGNNGGAIAWEGGGNLTIQNSTFTGNTAAAANGGGLFIDNAGSGGSITLTNTTFSANTAGAAAGGGQGGGAYLALGGNSATFNTVTFSNNSAESVDAASPGRGGGLHLASGTLTISISTFSGNAARLPASGGPGEGGAAYDGAGTLSITYNRITGNTAATGSGLFHGSASGALTAANVWWGCNGGPGSAGCDGTGGPVTVSSRLIFTLQATPASVYATHSAYLSTGFSDFQTGLPVSPLSLLGAFSGVPVTFDSALLGVIGGSPAPIIDGSASATFTAGLVAGPGGASATLDNQTVSIAIPVLPLKKIYFPIIAK